MKYFTPDLIERFGSLDDAVASAADAEWESLNDQYQERLRQIEPELPDHIREFNNLLLHDARVYSMARKGDQLIMVLHMDIPPRDLVILTYELTEEPFIDPLALPPADRSPVMDFLYDEFDLVRAGDDQHYTQSILFGNGWEVRLCFRDVRVTLAEPAFPVPDTAGFPPPARMVAQTA